MLDFAARERLPERLSHVWLEAGYTGQDKDAGWVERMLGWTAEIVRHPKKPAPEEVMRAWVREFDREGIPIDVDKLLAGQGPSSFLPKRWRSWSGPSLGSLTADCDGTEPVCELSAISQNQ